ncbi:MAG TPA: amidohydrolase family protein [Actinomycetales bacterium]|nr:amidohydrolase family protein [Actinomycetales bacterium]
MPHLLIRNVRPWPRTVDAPAVDVLVSDGRISEIRERSRSAGTRHPTGEHSTADEPPADVVDGRGGVLLPSFSDVHAHLDSTRLGLPFRPHTAEPGLAGLVENDRRNWRHAEATVAQRATYTLGRTIAAGATLVRSHAQVDPDSGLERLDGVLAAREHHASRARVEVVAFPQAGVIREAGTADLLEQALLAGADLIGGLDPCAFDRDPVAQLDVVFGLADKHGRGVDIHLHEPGELGAFSMELICERVAALSMQGRVTISHAFALCTVDAARQAQLVDLLVEQDVAVTTVAPGTRDPLPLVALREKGVRLGLGQDGIRDYWSPYGNGDMLDRAWQMAFRAGYRADAMVEACVEVATLGGRSVVDGSVVDGSVVDSSVVDGAAGAARETESQRGLAVGDRADLVIVPGDTVTAAVMDRPARTAVIHAGVVVARDGELV